MKKFKYLVKVDEREEERVINIPLHIFDKISEKYNDSLNDYILSKIRLHQWEFDNLDTHKNIIKSIELDIV